MGIQLEFQEFVAKCKAAAADGRLTLDELGDVADEALDVVAPVWDSLDPNNPDAVKSLESDLLELANDVIDNLPDGRFIPRAAAKTGASLAIPWLVTSAAKAGQPLRQTVIDAVGPKTRAAENFFHKINVKLGA